MNIILFFNLILGFIVISLLLYSYFEIVKVYKKIKMFNPFLIISLVLITLWYIIRILISGFYPFVSLFETLVFFSSLILLDIIFIKYINPFIKALIFLIPAIIYFAALILPIKFKVITSADISLKSFWIIIHVPAFFLGYTSILLSFIFSIRLLYLINKNAKLSPLPQPASQNEINNIAKFLNLEIYKAFILITIGLITGSIWADYTWKTFWSWDPKETSALILWISISFYFHFKNPKIKAIITIISFLILIFTYIGISYLFSGLHSYI